MGNGFDIFKYKQKLDDERAAKIAKYGKKNTIGMKLTRCIVYGLTVTMIWSLSTTFNLLSLHQSILNLVLIGAFLYLSYQVFKQPTQSK